MRSLMRTARPGAAAALAWLLLTSAAWADGPGQILTEDGLNVRALLEAGGLIGFLPIALSVAMVALIVEHMLSIRRTALMPPGLAEECRRLVAASQISQADQLCRARPSFLGYVLSAGLQEAGTDYEAVEKSLEDTAHEQAARLFRKIEYLSVIGTIAPMIGLTGTVWGMIQAFGEFANKANPQVAEFAPGISHALVTTMFGLLVAIPSLSAFALFRNRIDEYVAETALQAEYALHPLKQALRGRARLPREARPAEAAPPRTPPPPVARERESPR